MHKKTMITGITVLTVLIILFGIYLGIGMHYETHFFEHTSINGIDVSDMTVEEAEQSIASTVENYQLTLITKDGSRETISGDQMQYHFVSGSEVLEILDQQNIMMWLFRYFGSTQNHTMETLTSYDPGLLKQAMRKLNCFNEQQVILPSDAELKKQMDGTYVIIPEVEGNELKEEAVYELLERAVESGEKQINLTKGDCYQKPAVYANDPKLTGQMNILNRYASMSVIYDLGGEASRTLDSETIRSWMTLGEDNRPVFDRSAVQSYVEQLAADYDTIGTWEPFTTSLGETVYVEARTYGWQINQEQETEELYQILLTGESVERSPVYYESAITRGDNDIGNSYVEIDYTNQRMWYYKNGTLIVDTPIVTGNVAKGTESPEGIFCLVGKSEDEVLKGEGYATPVEYWMPFFGGVGIHDADSWRGSAYGGTIYQYSGSHGCINTPTANAAAIYSNIEVGTPIVCYKATINLGAPATGDAAGTTAGDAAGMATGEAGNSNSENGGDNTGVGGNPGGSGNGIEVIGGDSSADGNGAGTDNTAGSGAGSDIIVIGGEDWADESTYWG